MNSLLALVPVEAVKARLEEINTEQEALVKEVTDAWDDNKTVDTRAVRRKYVAFNKERKQLQEHLAKAEQPQEDTHQTKED